MSEKKTVSRYRNFATIVYPDSAPPNWVDILSDAFIPAFVSPLHDKDIDPYGQAKKPHYHVILAFEGKKSFEQVREIVETFGGVGLEKVNSLRGYARYLCHLDNPEKAQYPIESVKSLCGADYVGCIGLPVDKYKSIREIVSFCSDNLILSYSDLLEYCMQERPDWFRVLCDSGTFVIKEYLKSKAWTYQQSETSFSYKQKGEEFDPSDE